MAQYQISIQKCEHLHLQNGTFCIFFNINQLRCYFSRRGLAFFQKFTFWGLKKTLLALRADPRLRIFNASAWTQLEYFKLIQLKTHFLPLLKIMHHNFLISFFPKADKPTAKTKEFKAHMRCFTVVCIREIKLCIYGYKIRKWICL